MMKTALSLCGKALSANPWISIRLLTPLLAFCVVLTGQTTVVFDAAPDATETVAWSINAGGDATGWFIDAAGKRRGFVRSDGVIIPFDADPAAASTEALGINSTGEITGRMQDGNLADKPRGFVRDVDGNFVLFDADPSAAQTVGVSINPNGYVAGAWSPSSLGQGFVRDPDGNIVVFQADPAAVQTLPFSLNAAGDVVGSVFIQPSPVVVIKRAFIRDSSGNVVLFDVDAGAPFETDAAAINGAGDVAGSYRDFTLSRGPG